MKEGNGSCGCGAVEYALTAKIMNVVNCHCNMCKEHSGASFSTYAVLPFTALEINKGGDEVSQYKLGEGQKHFCKKCGTPIYNTNKKYPGACMIFLGTLKNSTSYTPKINIWCESQFSWVSEVSKIDCLEQGIENINA